MSALILPPAITPDTDTSDTIDDLDAHYDAGHDIGVSAFDLDAAQSTRDDGMLFHGCLPCDDVDAFNPSTVARPEIPPPALDTIPSWMERTHGGDPIGTGLPRGWDAL